MCHQEVLHQEKLLDLIKEEINVKEIIFDNKIKEEIELDTNITEELKKEGIAREIVRSIQNMRKELGLSHYMMCDIGGTNFILPLEFQEELKKEVGIKNFVISEPIKEADIKKEITIDGKKYWVFIKK